MSDPHVLLRTGVVRRRRSVRHALAALRVLVAGLGLVIGLLAGTADADSSQNLQYHGSAGGVGVMTGQEKVYLVLWGSQWGTTYEDPQGWTALTGDPKGAAPYLQRFFAGLGTQGDPWSGVMTQYCEGVPIGAQDCPAGAAHVAFPTGGALAGIWVDSTGPSPVNSSGHQIAQEAVAAAAHFGNVTPAANHDAVYMIMSPTGGNPDGWLTANWCAYHDWSNDPAITSGPVSSSYGTVAYVNLPYLPDRGCGTNTVNGGTDQGWLDGFSIVGGHEYAEAITDPTGGGWFASSSSSSVDGENGDLCAPITGTKPVDIGLATGTFAVQPTWSNAANNGTGGCTTHGTIINGGGIVNGDFDTGPQGEAGVFLGSTFGWGTTGASSISTAGHPGTAGGYALELGATGPTGGDSNGMQKFAVPPGQSYLSFWYRTFCTDQVAADYATASLQDFATSPTTTTTVLQPVCLPDSGWQPVSVSVVAGHTYTLKLTNHDDGDPSHPTYTLFTGVALSANPPVGVQLSSPTAGLTATDNNSATNPGIALAWTAQTGAQAYDIFRDGSKLATVNGLVTSYTDYTAAPNTTYRYSLDAVAGNSAVTGPTQPVSGTMWLPAVTGVTATGPGTAIQIAWNAQLGTSYNIYRDGVEIRSGITGISWTDTGATQTGPPHAYRVTVMRGTHESLPSAPATWVDPNAPAGVTVDPGLSLKIPELDVSWNPVPGATAYNVYRDGALKASGLTGTGFADKTIQADTTYNYTVSAVVAGVETGQSAWVSGLWTSVGGTGGGTCTRTICS